MRAALFTHGLTSLAFRRMLEVSVGLASNQKDGRRRYTWSLVLYRLYLASVHGQVATAPSWLIISSTCMSGPGDREDTSTRRFT